MMFYIQDATCISSQATYRQIQLEPYKLPAGNRIEAIEPSYTEIPDKILRRMGKAVRLGVGAAMPLIKNGEHPDGIIIGTANGGMEDCIKFLNQIIEYEEGMLTPTNFVQSTANAVAGQVGLLLKNTGYNITHVHRGHSFENAIIDAAMHLSKNSSHKILLGAVDEISAYNYNIDLLDGWYKTAPINYESIYDTTTPGSYPGEGSAMFIVDSISKPGSVAVRALKTVTSSDPLEVSAAFRDFMIANDLDTSPADLYLSGENGDPRSTPFYFGCSSQLASNIPVLIFKHISGEYATASSIALWLCYEILQSQQLPQHMMRFKIAGGLPEGKAYKKILLYNSYKNLQHSFMLCSID